MILTLRKTPYYEEVLYRMMDGVSYWKIFEFEKNRKSVKEFIKKVGNKLLPKNTRRRRVVKKIVRR